MSVVAFLCMLVANTAPSASTVTLNQDQKIYELGAHTRILEVEGEHLPAHVVLNHPALQKSDSKIPNKGFSSNTYWFRLDLQGDPERRTEWLLEIGYPLLDNIDFYEVRNDQILPKYETGDNFPFDQRKVNHRHFVFPIDLEAAETVTLLLRVNTQSSVQLPLSLWNRESFRDEDQKNLIFFGFMYGVLLVMIIYNLAVYTLIRDATYIYYCAYVLAFVLFRLGFDGLGFQYLWSDSIWWNAHIIPFAVLSITITSGRFTQYFLNTAKEAPTGHKWLSAMVVLALGWMVLSIPLSYSLAIKGAIILAALICSIFLIQGFVLLRRGYRPARVYLLAWGAVILSSFFIILSKTGIMERTPITERAQEIGLMIQALLFSFGLRDKISDIQKEREKVQANLLEQYEKHSETLKEYEALRKSAPSTELHETEATILQLQKRSFFNHSEVQRSREMRFSRNQQIATLLPRIFNDLQAALELTQGASEKLRENQIDEGSSEPGQDASPTDQIRLGCRRIEKLVNALQQYAVPKHSVANEIYPLTELLEGIQAVLAPQLKGIEVKISADQSLNIRGDIDSVTYILMAVLLNAIESFEEIKEAQKQERTFFDGKISITTERSRGKDGTLGSVIIEDNGPGIEEEDIEGALEPYGSKKDPERFQGLGLSLAQSWLEESGGSISIEKSARLSGTKVILNFPVL